MTRKRMIVALIPILGILIVAAIFFYPAYPFLTSSTDLSEESIGPFHLNEQLDEAEFASFGNYKKSDQQGGYGYLVEGSHYLKTNESGEIVSISIGRGFSTSSGIEIDDPVEKVIDVYGDHYYTYREMGLGDAIVYIDRDNARELTVWTMDELVTGVWLNER